ncbi:MAG: hypothetical protein EOP20_02745 [Hyphomicrobiales bacterium]|nr:MAG: hypothetical protein EOP20_02745 [Hyphomicrobiales bacterium]
MGRASRKRKEQRQTAVNNPSPTTQHENSALLAHAALPHKVVFSEEIEPQPIEANTKIYRFMNSEKFADDFAIGKIRLSTLKKCRAYEDPLQGDSEEAIHRYNSGRWTGSGIEAKARLARMGVFVGGATDVFLSNNTVTSRIEDAYILCATDKFDPSSFKENFGDYCIEISQPKKFFEVLTNSIRKTHLLAEEKWGLISYAERFTQGLNAEPGRIGFVKPMRYSPQREVRFLWRPKFSTNLEFFNLDVPECADYCKRII